MIVLKDKVNCSGCGACVNVCPQKCVSMKADGEGFLYPQIDEEQCVNCHLCEKVCPVLNHKEDTFAVPVTIACFNKNQKEQTESSSGGVFSLLAEHIVTFGGVAYGAVFKDAYTVCHQRIDSVLEIEKLRKSKYLQSETYGIYKQVEKDLKNNKQVLFSGTNCQIAGIKNYLKKEYENLTTVDIICHGVPSQKVWKKYLQENGFSERAKVDFRNKENGWLKYQILVEEDGKQTKKSLHFKDKYMKSFLSDCNLRPSCFNCQFKGVDRMSDLTLADFWGVKTVCPEMFSENGTSAVLIHTQKGQELFDKVSDNLTHKKVGFDDVVRFNKSYLYSAKPHKNRKKFFDKLDSITVSKIVNKYIEPSALKKCLRKVKRCAKKIIDKINK